MPNDPRAPAAPSLLELATRHDAVLLDAYGVLVDASGAIDGARGFVEALVARGIRFAIVTNDASRLPETLERRFRGLGFPIDAEQIVSSGQLLDEVFARPHLRGARAVVLGPADSLELVRRAGGRIVAPGPDAELDALVVCDEAGFPFLETLDAATNMVFAELEAGRQPALVLPNPDLLYPKGRGALGFAAGAIAELIERAIELRHPLSGRRFERLGKPFARIFHAALERLGTRNVLMVGDQLTTDIAGAAAAGIPSALVTWGVTRRADLPGPSSPGGPTYIADRFR